MGAGGLMNSGRSFVWLAKFVTDGGSREGVKKIEKRLDGLQVTEGAKIGYGILKSMFLELFKKK